jgi:AcrR family transcriptional regulator
MVDGRSERSRLTRRRVIDAASLLFAERGYVATTVEAIADGAGVAVQTVYYLFGTKRNLLARVLDASIAGDLEPVPIAERPWVAELREEPDGAVAVARLVRETVAIVARAAPVYETIRRAAADPDVGDLLAENLSQRRVVQRQLVLALHAAGHLHPDLDVDAAADVFYAVMNEEVYQLLVGVCGWDVEQFGRWATSLMVDQLIAGGATSV